MPTLFIFYFVSPLIVSENIRYFAWIRYTNERPHNGIPGIYITNNPFTSCD